MAAELHLNLSCLAFNSFWSTFNSLWATFSQLEAMNCSMSYGRQSACQRDGGRGAKHIITQTTYYLPPLLHTYINTLFLLHTLRHKHHDDGDRGGFSAANCLRGSVWLHTFKDDKERQCMRPFRHGFSKTAKISRSPTVEAATRAERINP